MYEKIYKIEVCPRVDLYFSNDGFLFTNKILKKNEIRKYFEFNRQIWGIWVFVSCLYLEDGIIEKVNDFKSKCSNKQKAEKFFQGLIF